MVWLATGAALTVRPTHPAVLVKGVSGGLEGLGA